MTGNERSKKLRVFLRVGAFAIATALSVVALIRILAVSRQIQFMQRQLDTTQSAGEDIKRKNDQLQALVSLRDLHRAAAIRNEASIGRYYQLCREPNDIPPLKTDFVVREDSVFNQFPKAFAFSVPEGGHKLQIASQKGGMGGMGGSKTILTIPLLPSSGYFMQTQVEPEGESNAGQLFVELTSNNTAFKPIRQQIGNSQFHSSMPFLPSTFLSEMVELRVQLKSMGNTYGTYGKFGNLSYPNSAPDLVQVGIQGRGVELASSYASSNETPFTLSFSVVSDSPQCISAQTAIQFRGSLGRLQPYTGNGRFYILPKN